MKQPQTQSLSKHYLILGYFVFGILIREIVSLVMLLCMLVLILYHMFPQNWFRSIFRELREFRAAYDVAFGKSFDAKFKARIAQSD
jgi:hypothetical protein